MKNKKFFVLIAVVFIILIISFIFSRSIPNQEESARESSAVKNILQPIIEFFLEPIFGVGSITDNVIRKTAHFVEFCSLGIVIGILSRIFERKIPVYGFLSVVLVALCDETIQLFSERGSQVQDVWLDIFGATVGIIISYVAVFLIVKIKNHKHSV